MASMGNAARADTGPSQSPQASRAILLHVGPVWGSFERNTGTFNPYSAEETAAIEVAWTGGADSVDVPTCFNATVNFNRTGGSHYQTTPAVGSKPPGFRSVLRGQAGESVILHWWDNLRMWRLDQSPAAHSGIRCPIQEIRIIPPEAVEGVELGTIWQWCDLPLNLMDRATEANWRPYAHETSQFIEDGWSHQTSVFITIGFTQFRIGTWEGTYGVQHNLNSGNSRQVRRGRVKRRLSVDEDLVDDSCALCMEKFVDTPEWPVRKTPCNHVFHGTCLQHMLQPPPGTTAAQRGSYCPMCRQSLHAMAPVCPPGA